LTQKLGFGASLRIDFGAQKLGFGASLRIDFGAQN
jgi:hypothetical protein